MATKKRAPRKPKTANATATANSTIDALCQIAIDAAGALSAPGCDNGPLIGVGLTSAVRLRARKSQAAEIEPLLEAIGRLAKKQPFYEVSAAFQAITILGKVNREAGLSLLQRYEKQLERAEPDHADASLFYGRHPRPKEMLPFVAAPVASAYAALGDRKRSQAWLETAISTIEPEWNPWEKRLTVSWAMAEIGSAVDARTLWEERSWSPPPNDHFALPWVLHLLRSGRSMLLHEFLSSWKSSGAEIPYGVSVGLLKFLVNLGMVEEIRRFSADFAFDAGDWSGKLSFPKALALAAANASLRGQTREPTPEESLSLAQDRSAVVNKRRLAKSRLVGAAKGLAIRAALVGDVGVAIEAIGLMPTDVFDHRLGTALSALWIMETGFDVLPW
jgi:hypothetical protein